MGKLKFLGLCLVLVGFGYFYFQKTPINSSPEIKSIALENKITRNPSSQDLLINSENEKSLSPDSEGMSTKLIDGQLLIDDPHWGNLSFVSDSFAINLNEKNKELYPNGFEFLGKWRVIGHSNDIPDNAYFIVQSGEGEHFSTGLLYLKLNHNVSFEEINFEGGHFYKWNAPLRLLSLKFSKADHYIRAFQKASQDDRVMRVNLEVIRAVRVGQ
jgi:hypothetical protein